MAKDLLVQIDTTFEGEGQGFFLVQLSVTSDSFVTGDTLRFRWNSHQGGNQPSSVTISGWNIGSWTNSNTRTITLGQTSAEKTVRASPTVSQDALSVATSSGGSRGFTANVSSGIDITPDPFSLGSVVNSANPNSVYIADVVRITGLGNGQSATASISSPGVISKNNGISYTSGTLSVLNGDRILVKITASNDYGVLLSTRLSIDTEFSDWSVRTINDPSSGQIIAFGRTTGNIALSEIRAFFGGISNTLDDYRIGAFVPNLSQNSKITSDPNADLALTHFRGAVTSLYFNDPPDNRESSPNTVSSGGLYFYEWGSGPDWELGFGAGMTDVCEYRYEFVNRKLEQNGTVVDTTDVTMASASAGTYNTANNSLRINVTVPTNVERHYYGTIRFFARHPSGVATTTEVTFDWFFYGP
jgi:hypothetical protein